MDEREKELELEYITGAMSLKALGEKHGIQENVMKKLSCQNRWGQKRRDFRQKAINGALDKALGEQSQRLVPQLETLLEIAEQLCRALGDLTQDKTQFHLHLLEAKEKVTTGPKEVTERQWTEEKELKKVDIRAMREVTGVLKDLTGVIRDLAGIPTQPEAHRQLLDEVKLDMEREKPQDDGGEIRLSQEVEELAR